MLLKGTGCNRNLSLSTRKGAADQVGVKFPSDLSGALYEDEIGLIQEVPNIADPTDLFRDMVVSGDYRIPDPVGS